MRDVEPGHRFRSYRSPVLSLALSLTILGGSTLSSVVEPGVAQAAPISSNWTTFDQSPLRTGVDTSGNSFTGASEAWTSPTLDGQLYGQPLVYADRVFAATENDTVYALAADSVRCFGPNTWPPR